MENEREHLRVLFVEDSADAVSAMRRALTSAGFDLDALRVENERELRDALTQHWDIVISDCQLPDFDGIAAADITRQVNPRLPVIFVSGTLSEERAAAAMRAGARDFVPKTALGRLVPAVEREVRDARERVRARSELARERRFGLAVFNALPGPKCVIDHERRVVMVNDEFAELAGGARTEGSAVAGVLGSDIAHPELMAAIDDLLERGKGFQDLELRFERDGKKRVIVANGLLLGDEDPTLDGFAVLSLRDDTARTVLKEQLYAAQRMEVVGRLVGGVAHDFNNILSVVTSYAYFLQPKVEGDETAQQDLDTVLEAAERGANLIGQLLAFTRSSASVPRLVDVNEIVRSLERMLGRVLGEDVRLEQALSAAPQVVSIDPTHLEQILMNLVVNARDAMPDGGQVYIEVTSVELGPDYIVEKDPVTVPQGTYARLTVRDTGTGMSAEVANRVFEPYFTTKRARGTGLGLSTVYGLVKQAEGFIWLYTEPGEGTTFRIYLPLQEGAQADPDSRKGAASTVRGSETLLVVEDKATLRQAMVRTLSGAGYSVLEAENGADALILCERYSGRIDALVTDVIMPIMNGVELREKLIKNRQGLRTLFVSGYAGYASTTKLPRESADTQLLEKPFAPDDLLKRVRQLLDAS